MSRTSKALLLPLLLTTTAFATQDRYAVASPNGISFSEFRGYEDWQNVAVSQVEDGLKLILANPAMIGAYRAGVPHNGKAFPEGSKIVKIEWSVKKNPVSPYEVTVPDALRSVSFIEKDSKRFPATNGWGYAQFTYDATAKAFAAVGSGKDFGKAECHECHVAVKANDYIFTAYPER